ncbi:MAG: AraC family transcriptional regulator [Verrucomicrobia bacterium]|nr:AraC family transcriptional regulator [Verrucomicrobiota bacterium]MBU4247299.1 AraC family transcriptional regulator [Verrucomicrobiota bacterium]MBU4290696.1 AraC family transcriptional regulator [Verrucomicrobiota bacterium]MBU4497546.1 AraC family transcriptional regulator [Verrucomicrobiota bacterium]MCG2680010.1 AraC family transcriptional regulator [Kiritimatiellia bacterium]
MNNHIREIHIIGLRCRERFLPLLKDGPLRQAGVLLAGVSDLKGKYVISRSTPGFCLVLGTLAGQARLFTPQKKCRLTPLNLLVAPAGSHYRYELVGGKLWRIVWFHLAPSAHPEWFKHLKGLTVVPSFEIQHLEREALDLVDENERRQFMAFQARQAKEEYLTVQLQRIFLTISGSAPRSYDTVLCEIWRKVMDQPARKWSLRELADIAGYSAGHLNRLCRCQYGHAAIKHLTELKMQYACNLLSQGILKVQTVAEKCGYQNEFAFSTAFKRHFNVPPRQIKNS